jgi:hypothetical protein
MSFDEQDEQVGCRLSYVPATRKLSMSGSTFEKKKGSCMNHLLALFLSFSTSKIDPIAGETQQIWRAYPNFDLASVELRPRTHMCPRTQ